MKQVQAPGFLFESSFATIAGNGPLTQALWVMMKVILKVFFFQPYPRCSKCMDYLPTRNCKKWPFIHKGKWRGEYSHSRIWVPTLSFVGAWRWGMDNFILTSYFGRTLCGERTRRFYVFSFEVLFSGLIICMILDVFLLLILEILAWIFRCVSKLGRLQIPPKWCIYSVYII